MNRPPLTRQSLEPGDLSLSLNARAFSNLVRGVGDISRGTQSTLLRCPLPLGRASYLSRCRGAPPSPVDPAGANPCSVACAALAGDPPGARLHSAVGGRRSRRMTQRALSRVPALAGDGEQTDEAGNTPERYYGLRT